MRRSQVLYQSKTPLFLEDGRQLAYRALIVCPGLKLHWDAIKGLRKTLGKNGVTSNYMPRVVIVHLAVGAKLT